jgi:hypothetical protein
MKRVFAAALLIAPLASAATLSVRPLSRPFTVRATQQGGGFSVDLPIVGHVRGATTTFFTALDITNNTPQSTDVEFFFTPADGSAPRFGVLTTLSGFDNFHTEDFLQSLAAAGVISPSQAENSFGTLLLTFTNPAYHRGSEASAVARIYSLAVPSGTYGLAYRARPVETNGAHSLSSVIRNGGGLVSNLGIENVGVDDRGAADANPVTVRLSFFDPASGSAVGTQPTITLAPGQVVQINDVFPQNGFQLPAVSSLLLFVDEVTGSAQIRGYVVVKDSATNDGAFVFMQESPSQTF